MQTSNDTNLAGLQRESGSLVNRLAETGARFLPSANSETRLAQNRKVARSIAGNSMFTGQVGQSGDWAIKENNLSQLFSLTRLFDFLAKASKPHLGTAIEKEETVAKSDLPNQGQTYRSFRDALNPIVESFVPIAQKFFPDQNTESQIGKNRRAYRKAAENFDVSQKDDQPRQEENLLGLTRLIDFMARSLKPYLKMSETSTDEVRSQVNDSLNSLAERIEQSGDELKLEVELNESQESIVKVKDGDRDLFSFLVRSGNELYSIDAKTQDLKGESFNSNTDLPLDIICIYHFPAPTLIRETGTKVKYLGMPEAQDSRENSSARGRVYQAIESKLMPKVPALRKEAGREFLVSLQQAGELDSEDKSHSIYLLGCNIGFDEVDRMKAEVAGAA
jgi:hypothetical protein